MDNENEKNKKPIIIFPEDTNVVDKEAIKNLKWEPLKIRKEE